MGLRHRKPKYEVVLWTIHIAVTILAIVDRFTTNVWPRQSFTIGAGSAGNDRMVGFKEGPWSVVTYDILARVSGRYSIVTFNFMLISRLRILEQGLASSFVGRYVLDCRNIVKANLHAHRWNGIALTVLTLVHVWSIVLPCVTHKWSAQVIPGRFEWPLSERTPPGFKDADVTTETMSLQVDDVFRMVEMTLLLGILMPLSIRWMSRCWHLGIHVHRFITVIYFVDIVRRHSHPHSWVLNTPIFCLWIADKVACLFWRQVKYTHLNQERISEDYTVMYWNAKSDKHFNDAEAVGSNYLMKLHPSTWLESPHPFTSFKNRVGKCDFLSNDSWRAKHQFTHGVVVRTFHNVRKPPIGGEKRSHTERMAADSTVPPSLFVWGPFQGQVTNLIPKAFPHEGGSSEERSVVLAGSGSAINFQIDLLNHLSCGTFNLGHKNLKSVILLYSTRDRELFLWVAKAISKLLDAVDMRFKSVDEQKIRIVLACTSSECKSSSVALDRTFELGDDSTFRDDNSASIEGSKEEDAADTEEPFKEVHSLSCIEFVSGRLDYDEEIPEKSWVYCQGSEPFTRVVAAGCRGKKGVRLHLDR